MARNKFLPGNPGRPKGALNKTTYKQKEEILEILGFFKETLKEDIENMSSSERVHAWMDLQEFLLPKLQRTQMEVEGQIDTLTQITFKVIGSDGKAIERIGGIRKELHGYNENSSEPGFEQIG
ncbi:MAG: hypothetical protein ACOYMF_15190 [Bacteroidales bacterium]